MDDFLIFSNNRLEDYRIKVKKVLERLDKAELFLDIDKYKFKIKKVKYLGYVINYGKIIIDIKKVDAIRD